MAASTSIIPGIDFLIKAGGNQIGGGTNGTLTLNQETADATNKTDINWKTTLNSTRSWALDFESVYLESTSEVDGEDIAVTLGGDALKGVKTATLTLSTEFDEVVNSTVGLDTNIVPTKRTAVLDVDFDYYDPLGSGATALSTAINEIQGSTTSAFTAQLTFSSADISFQGRPTSVSFEVPQDGRTQGRISIESTGAFTDDSTGEDTAISAILDAWTGTTTCASLTVLMATATTTNSEYTGTAYPTQLTMTVPIEGRVDFAGTFTGHGALTWQATS